MKLNKNKTQHNIYYGGTNNMVLRGAFTAPTAYIRSEEKFN